MKNHREEDNIWETDDFTYAYLYNNNGEDYCAVDGFSLKGIEKYHHLDEVILTIPEHSPGGAKVIEIRPLFKHKQYTSDEFCPSKIVEIAGSWKNVVTIATDAFGSHKGYLTQKPINLRKIPDDWGSVRHIGDYVFADSKIERIPSDWNQVENLGIGCFQNTRIKRIPNTFGKISSILDATFAHTKLTMLPEDFSSIELIGTRAFASCRGITKLPVSLFDVPIISNEVFADCSIRHIDTWGSMQTIPEGFIRENPLESIPDTWQQVKVIEPYAFIFTDIKKIPDDWESVEYVGDEAFRKTNITMVPENPGRLEYVGKLVFASCPLG